MRIAVLDYQNAVPTCVTGPADIWGGLNRMYPLVTGMQLKESIGIDFINVIDDKIVRRPMVKIGSGKLALGMNSG